jgi:lipopolysaccharide transport system ATP-binding protein
MGGPAVKVDGVGKWYRLGNTLGPGALLTEQLAGLLRSPGALLKRGRKGAARNPEDNGIWALKDVSFELHRGEALGLVGRNGAGKSTLLKLLSRITLPTQGRMELRGRIATLLEVGTGFHPELTGRENVYLNGAILGMRRAEIARKFDEIIEFSGVERFIDTPVKRYSSGMYVRLGFAVAAHLDPDILLVDEVLAVGDAEFQRKCLGKMRDAAGEGRAVVFVSHNISAVQRLCTRALLIDDGRVVLDGGPDKVADAYLAHTQGLRIGGVSSLPGDIERGGSGEALLRQVVLRNAAGETTDRFHLGEPLRITATYEVLQPVEDVCIEFAIMSTDGDQLVTAQSIDRGRSSVDLTPGWIEVEAEVSATLLPHEFNLGVGIHRAHVNTVDFVERAHTFTTMNVDLSGDDRYSWPVTRGYVRPESTFEPLRRVSPLSVDVSSGDGVEYVAAASSPVRETGDRPTESTQADGDPQR